MDTPQTIASVRSMSASHSSDDGSSSASNSYVPSNSSSGDQSLRSLGYGETCAYRAPNAWSGCRVPRSCQSCLTIEGCMVNTGGACVSTADVAVVSWLQFTTAIEFGIAMPNATQGTSQPQRWQFQAGATSYCAQYDPVCRECRVNNFWRSYSSTPDNRFCVGENGCVCIDACERRWLVQQDCPTTDSTATPSASATQSEWSMRGSEIVEGLLAAMLVVIGVAFVSMFVVARRRKARERRQEAAREERRLRREAHQQRRHARSNELGVSVLNLTGWESYRRDLITKEQSRLNESSSGVVSLDATSIDENFVSDSGNLSPTTESPSATSYVRLEDGTTTESLDHTQPRHEQGEQPTTLQAGQSLAPLRRLT